MTDEDEKKQVLTLSLHRHGQAKVGKIDVEKLSNKNGRQTLTTELDNIFLRNFVNVAHENCTTFDKYHRDAQLYH